MHPLLNNGVLLIKTFLTNTYEGHPGSAMRPLVNNGDPIIETVLTTADKGLPVSTMLSVNN